MSRKTTKKKSGHKWVKKRKFSNLFNPSVPSVLNIGRLAKTFNFNLGRDHQKNVL